MWGTQLWRSQVTFSSSSSLRGSAAPICPTQESNWGKDRQGRAETCSEPFCPSLQGLPTEDDFSEVLTQVHKVGSLRRCREGRMPS